MDKASKIIQKLCNKLDLVAGIIFFINCLVVVVNIIARSALIGKPIFGSYEIICYLSLISVSLALAYSAVLGGHIRLTFFVEKMSKKPRGINEIIISVIVLINFAIITWKIGEYMISRIHVGDVSPVLRIPIQYFVAFIVLGFLLLTLTSLLQIITETKKLRSGTTDKTEKNTDENGTQGGISIS